MGYLCLLPGILNKRRATAAFFLASASLVAIFAANRRPHPNFPRSGSRRLGHCGSQLVLEVVYVHPEVAGEEGDDE
jgi:hypothetical protein